MKQPSDDGPEDVHPLLRLYRPSVATPSINTLAEAVHTAFDDETRALNVFGYAQYGKSRAIEYLRTHTLWLKSRGRTAAMRSIVIPDMLRRSDRTFPKLLLTLLGIRAAGRADALELGILLANTMMAFCHEKRTRTAILFLDEGNRLQPADFEFMAWLDAQLVGYRYVLFYVIVHQRDVTGFSNETLRTPDHPPHVSARFRFSSVDFSGMRGEDDVAYVADRFDTKNHWPSKSGISFTAHFVPEAFAAGFRLRQLAPRLWRLAEAVRAEQGLQPEWTWPMRSLEHTLVNLLTQVAPRIAEFTDFTDEQLRKAIIASRLVELERQRIEYHTPGGK